MKKRILRLAVPTIIENTFQTSVGFVDTLMISTVGLAAIAGIGTANSIMSVYLAVFIAIAVGVSSLISRNIGASNKMEARKVAIKGTMLLVLISILFTVITLLFSDDLLIMMGLENDYLDKGASFLSIVGGMSVFIGLITLFGSILRAQGDTKTPMYIGLIVNIINVVLNYVLIFGFLFIPAMGVVGAAIATVISRIVGTSLLFIFVQKSEIRLSLRVLRVDKEYKPLIKLIVPAGLERLAMRFGQVLYFSLIVYISADTFAAHMIAGQVESFTYMPAYGLAAAAATLVGFSIGEKKYDEARKIGLTSVYLGIMIMVPLGIIEFVGAPVFASIFTDDGSVIKMVVTALRINAFFQPALAISIILTGALQGMGDTKSPLYSTVIGMWIMRVLGVYVLGILLDLGIAGVWLAIGIDLTIRSAFLLFKYFSHYKKFNKVNIVSDEG